MTTKREIIESSLREIWDERQRLTADDVVEVASQPEHPLHDFFQWSDGVAAHEYRRIQATGLIRSVKIRFTVERGEQIEDLVVRSWVAAKAAGPEAAVQSGYLPQEEVRQTPAIREAVLRQMRRDLLNMRKRYADMDEFWRLMDEILEERAKAS